jgi:hypothetical protein
VQPALTSHSHPFTRLVIRLYFSAYNSQLPSFEQTPKCLPHVSCVNIPDRHTGNIKTDLRIAFKPQQILFVLSIQATCFGSADNPRALNALYLKNKINCTYILNLWDSRSYTSHNSFQNSNENIKTNGQTVPYGISRKVAGSIPNGVNGIFHWHNPSGRTIALGSPQPLTEMSTRNISWGGKGGRFVRLTTLPPSCADCHEIWQPQSPGTLRACPDLYRISLHEITFLHSKLALSSVLSASEAVVLSRRSYGEKKHPVALKSLISSPREY